MITSADRAREMRTLAEADRRAAISAAANVVGHDRFAQRARQMHGHISDAAAAPEGHA